MYSDTHDEIVKSTSLDDVLEFLDSYESKWSLVEINSEKSYFIFVKRQKSTRFRQCLYLNDEQGGYAMYTRGKGFKIYSLFDQDEHKYILDLYDENIAELFQYMKKRFIAAVSYVHLTMENTKPMTNVKSAKKDKSN